MMNKKIFLTCLILIFSLNYTNTHACSLTNLTSCSFSDLKEFVSGLLSFEKKSNCKNVYLPVCSKSGKTFDNICLLKESKDKLDYYGRCLEYPYNLSANNCVKEKFDWDGYKCVKKEENHLYYENEELGFSLMLPSNSIINKDFIELPKERNNTNLIFKKLEFISDNYCSDILSYTKVNDIDETQKFKIVNGENSLDYGNDILANINYKYYILENKDSCIGFLFSIYSNGSFEKYNKIIESANFNEIMESLSFIEKRQEKKSPCENYGDLNSDNIINKDDLNYFIFGSVENNLQKRGDLNNDAIVDEKDQNILYSFIYENTESFPACSIEKDIKRGSAPKIFFNKNFNVKQDIKKTEANITINFDLIAEKGDIYIPANGMHLKILNDENVKIEDMTWNTGAQIKEDGYIFLEKGKTTWISVELNLKAKEKPIYTKALIDEISYLNEKGELKKISTPIETNKFYLNFTKDENLICGIYGDINDDGFINEEDISFIVTNKELNEDQKIRADVSGNGEVNIIDAIEIQKYILKGEPFTICSKTYTPTVYDNALVSVENNEDKTKHATLTFYLDSNNGDALIPARVSVNQDDESSGIYLQLEKDGSVIVKNLKLWSSAELINSGFLKIKKDTPNWIKIEFDIEAINDTALVNFKINKIAYLNNNEREYIYPSDIKTGDIFLNYEKKEFLSPCGQLGDLDLDNYVTYSDYDFLKNNLNILLKDYEKFIYADLNKDGIIDKLDLEELDDYLNQKINKFSGCLKDACNSLIEPVYTKDGFIYANECYLKKAQKEVKCYINKNCGL
ncbi:MAG: dockerin type I domain-containing protein [Minisyncoccales bacterium]|jgi:hypothetical protein